MNEQKGIEGKVEGKQEYTISERKMENRSQETALSARMSTAKDGIHCSKIRKRREPVGKPSDQAGPHAAFWKVPELFTGASQAYLFCQSFFVQHFPNEQAIGTSTKNSTAAIV